MVNRAGPYSCGLSKLGDPIFLYMSIPNAKSQSQRLGDRRRNLILAWGSLFSLDLNPFKQRIKEGQEQTPAFRQISGTRPITPQPATTEDIQN
ncbi:hypothetical protein HS088_TW02G00393 [Tripterygium wilfordii]|uniref:Uncharacterized protein n=1 Tax=Tripterygium wilfordii TaxID=458696 RepID=A0A7J7DYB8_TRIWF|nr:hypothetical protein HS088_TW02G00393 [Tripterygium wilfordii]